MVILTLNSSPFIGGYGLLPDPANNWRIVKQNPENGEMTPKGLLFYVCFYYDYSIVEW